MMTIHEQFVDTMESLGEQIKLLEPGSDKYNKLLETYNNMYRSKIDHDKIDEEIMDRREKMEKDSEKAEKEFEMSHEKMKHERIITVIKIAGLFVAFIAGTSLENHGALVPNLRDFKKGL